MLVHRSSYSTHLSPSNSFYSTLFAVSRPKYRTYTRAQNTSIGRLCARSLGLIEAARTSKTLVRLGRGGCVSPHCAGSRTAPRTQGSRSNLGTIHSYGSQMVSKGGCECPNHCGSARAFGAGQARAPPVHLSFASRLHPADRLRTVIGRLLTG